MKKIKKVVLAYSGGLDTSIIIPWLKENYQCEVIAVAADVGQGTELDGLEQKAIKTGASKLYVLDLVDEFCDDVLPTLKAGAVYEKKYLLGTSFARPIIAKGIVEIAKKEGADAIAHGCTGKGNDQVRFELTIKHFAPDMEIIAPWRVWDIKSREEEIDYAEAHNVPLKISRETNYSKDKNIWHLSHEGLDLEDPANEPVYDKILELGVSPEKAPDAPAYVTVSFEKGKPIALDGKKMKLSAIIAALNKLGGENGVGITDLVENRLVGMKSRGVYETPGGSILYFAHDQLETLCLDKETLHYKQGVALRFADLVYNGQWFTPLREALRVWDVTSRPETATNSQAYKGNIMRSTKPTLYSRHIATLWRVEDVHADGFQGYLTSFAALTVRDDWRIKKEPPASFPELCFTLADAKLPRFLPAALPHNAFA
jgi:argininosuccinate synthase